MCKEASWGAGYSTSDDYAFPTDPPTFSLIYETFQDQTLRGNASLDQEVYQSVSRVEATVEGPFYPLELGFFLLALLGSESLATGGSTGAHTFVGKTSDLPSLALKVDDDVTTAVANRGHVHSGMMPTSFGLRFAAAEGILTYTSSFTGKSRATSTDALPSYATVTPFLNWQGTYDTDTNSIGTAHLIDMDLTINRPPSLLYTLSEGGTSQTARRYDAGPIEVTGRFTMDFTSIDQYTAYEANTDVSLSVTFSDGSNNKLVVEVPNMKLLDAPMEISRSDISLQAIYSFRGIHASAYNAPIKFVLTNTRQTVY